MKLRIRFGEKRFTVDIEYEDATVLALKQAVCNAASVGRFCDLLSLRPCFKHNPGVLVHFVEIVPQS